LTSPAAVAQVDTSDWKCEYCPFDKGYRAEYDVGVSSVSDDAYRHGNGTGYDEKGAYAEVGGEGRYISDGTEVAWKAEDLGLDSRVFSLSAGKPGKFVVGLGYRSMPYRLFDSTSTVYSVSGGTANRPSSWTPAASTGGFSDLDASLRSIDIGTDRDILDVGFSFLPTQNVDVFVDYRRQQRDGIEIATGSTFTRAVYVPRVIDDYTDQIDAGVRFDAGPLNLALAWYGSFYRNDISALTWDNLFTPIPGADAGRTATEPDNDFQQFSLSGVYRTDALNTVVAFSAAMGQGEQTAELLPYSINTATAVPTLAVSVFDGKVDTSNYALTITSKPLPKARVKLAYRYDERDNQTPISTWTRVITDAFVTSDDEQNVPYSYERTRLTASGSYRLFDTVTVSGGYTRTETERDFQEVADQTEDMSWGQLRWRPTKFLEATFKGGDSLREVDEYDTTVAESLGQNPLMRKYYLAHRYREFAEVTLSASLPEKPLSVGMSYLYADDSYSQSELGMQSSEENRWTFDVSWAATENSTLYLTAGNEEIEAVQAGNESSNGPSWEATHDDDFSSIGAGFTVRGLADKVDLVFDYSHGEGETDILFAGPAVSATPLPELESTLDSLRFTLSYAWSEKLTTDFIIRYEAFETVDWALDGVLADTMPAVLTMGAESYDYDIWAVGVSFRYSVGADTE
jgi:MtrB/PioB family decaheme-associated outer membrane protein